MSTATNFEHEFDYKAAIARYGPDLTTLMASVGEVDEVGAQITALNSTHLSSVEDELHEILQVVEHITRVARDATGANPAIDGDDDEFVRIDATNAWHLSSFARTLRIKAAEIVDCADKLESSAYFGWQNKLDADIQQLNAARAVVA